MVILSHFAITRYLVRVHPCPFAMAQGGAYLSPLERHADRRQARLLILNIAGLGQLRLKAGHLLLAVGQRGASFTRFALALLHTPKARRDEQNPR